MMIYVIFMMILLIFFNSKYLLGMLMLLFCMIPFLCFNQFVENGMINEMLGMNLYSYMLLSLTFLIFGLIFIFFDVKNNDFFYFKMLMLTLLISLIFVFTSMNLLMFYFMFEISLVLMFFIIMKWGLGEMRELASFYLLFYTMFFSLPFLIFILDLYYFYNILMMYYFEMLKIKYLNMFMFLFFMFTFFVKIPMFMFHSWLLKAHVEAPVIGSMILAGILLKLGIYGLIRFMLMFMKNFIEFNEIIMYFSIFGSMLISILCMRQIDMKILVAYSSVVHMGLTLSGMMTLMNSGVKGSYMMMISHGLCSSGLFFLVNLCYLLSNSRLMLMNKGLMNLYPSMSLMWFLLCTSNLSAPLSLNLISEIFLIMSLVNWNFLNLFILMILMFFSFFYSLNLFSYTQHGEFNFCKINKYSLMDYLIVLSHWIPLNLFIFNLSMFL